MTSDEYSFSIFSRFIDFLYSFFLDFCTFSISFSIFLNTMPQSNRRLRQRRNGLCGCLKVFLGGGLHVRSRTYGHAHTGMHVRARESEGTACVVVSGMRFEFFLFCFVCTYGNTCTGTHLRACTSLINTTVASREISDTSHEGRVTESSRKQQ